MRANAKKFPKGGIFLLVSMATLIVMPMAVKVEVDETESKHQHKQQIQNETRAGTKTGISVNKTGGNLTLDLDLNSSDLTAEQQKKNHQIVMVHFEDDAYFYGVRRVVECRGKNIKSLSGIPCETMESCEEMKPLLFEQMECGGRLSFLFCGWECSNDGSGSSSNYPHRFPSASSCLRMEMSGKSAGIIQCTSEENGLNHTTFDHYAIGRSGAGLLSTFKNKKAGDLIKMKLYVSSLNEELNADSDKNSSVTLLVDEEVSYLECRVPKLLFHKQGMVIRAHMKDGSTVKLDSKVTALDLDGFLSADVYRYRVPADIVAFSCAAQMTNLSAQWLENRINVTSQGLLSQVIVKSSEGRNMTVKLTPGAKVNLHCELTGSAQLKKSIQLKMRGMNRYSKYMNEASSKSLIEFLRFVEVAGKHLFCKPSNKFIQRQMHLAFEGPFHFVFNFAPSAPKIYNPNPNPSPNSSSSLVQLIYQEDHVVDQTLLCLFQGEPEPVITWIKNGHKFRSTKPMGIRNHGNETLEHVKLELNSTTVQSKDFENGHVNFSCVLSNYFGSDRQDFIIMMTKTISTSTAQSTKEANFKSNSTFNSKRSDGAERSETIALVSLVFLIFCIFTVAFSALWKKRVAHSVGSVRILTFHNLIESEKNQSE